MTAHLSEFHPCGLHYLALIFPPCNFTHRCLCYYDISLSKRFGKSFDLHCNAAALHSSMDHFFLSSPLARASGWNPNCTLCLSSSCRLMSLVMFQLRQVKFSASLLPRGSQSCNECLVYIVLRDGKCWNRPCQKSPTFWWGSQPSARVTHCDIVHIIDQSPTWCLRAASSH